MPARISTDGQTTAIPPNLTPSEFARMMRLPPEQAVKFLESKGVVVTSDWRSLWQDENQRQFTISRLTRADLLQDIQTQLTRSVNGDLSRKDWMRNTEELLSKAGWWGDIEVLDPATGEVLTTRFNSNRLRLIFDVNTRNAYAAGQWQRFEAGKRTNPYLRYVTKRDERVRDSHKALNNLVLPVDHPFWATHAPPNGWRCRCSLTSMSQKDYDKGLSPRGDPLNKDAPTVEYRDWYNAKTGKTERVPVGIDPGWAYNPGKVQARDAAMKKMVDDKIAKLEPGLLAAVRKSSLSPLGEGHHVLDTWDGMGQRPGLFDLPPMPVVDVPADAFGGVQGKEALALAADQALRALQERGGLSNDDSGWLLTINNKARKKMGDNADQTPVDSKAVAVLAELVKAAVIGERHTDERHNNPDVQGVYRMFSAMAIGESMYRVQLTVKDYGDGDAPHKLHALESFEIEDALLGILPAYSGDESLQPAQPTTGRTISIKQLMQGAMRNDDNPYEIHDH